MLDQASQLRSLVLRAVRQREAQSAMPPRLIAVCGAGREVGASTIALHLALELVEQGSRVVLVDADYEHPSLAKRCEITPALAAYDPATARRDIHEALHRGPGGVQVVPGVWSDDMSLDKSLTQLHRQFQQLGKHADVIVVDLGAGPIEVLKGFRDADDVLVVTTTANAAVMDAYTLVKQAFVSRAGRSTQVLVNGTDDAAQAAEVFARINRSCRRFLGFSISCSIAVPYDSELSGTMTGCMAQLAAELTSGDRELRKAG